MGRPSKPFEVLKNEGRSHRTKAELETREKGEKALVSGEKWKEIPQVKANKVAHKEYMRLEKIFSGIGKNDALHQNIINRYCFLLAEIDDLKQKRERFDESLVELEKIKSENKIEGLEYLKLRQQLQAQFLSIDKQIQNKRKMMFDIEKENLMTMAAVLRCVPKKPEEEVSDDPMLKLLEGRM